MSNQKMTSLGILKKLWEIRDMYAILTEDYDPSLAALSYLS